MTDNLVTASIDNAVARIALSSPANRNALSRRLVAELHEALQHASQDDTVRVVVLTHDGPTFCAGADLKEVGSPVDPSLPTFPQLIELIWTFPKPVIARLGGPARAGGLGLAAAADIVIAEEDLTFALTEVRIGVVPAIISAVLLPRMAPAAAHRAFVTGAPFDAQFAAQIGLVDRVAPKGGLDSVVNDTINDLMLTAPSAFATTKKLVRDRQEPSICDRLAEMGALSETFFGSTEAAEGIAAFRDKRRPNWAVQ